MKGVVQDAFMTLKRRRKPKKSLNPISNSFTEHFIRTYYKITLVGFHPRDKCKAAHATNQQKTDKKINKKTKNKRRNKSKKT